MPVLTVDALNVFYGRIHALHDVSLTVRAGEIVAVIGANGAGKSTLLWTIMGVLKPKSGRVEYLGKPLPSGPEAVAASGIALVPERRRLFANLTVKENLLMGAFLRKSAADVSGDLEFVYRLFPILKARARQYAGTLSGGEQQMLAIGRALMARPKLILLDEPSLGLAPTLCAEVFATIENIKREGATVLLAEQNAFKALEMADRAYVLETGTIAMTGPGHELLENPHVQKAYLGVKA